jgi:hypothetical protein
MPKGSMGYAKKEKKKEKKKIYILPKGMRGKKCKPKSMKKKEKKRKERNKIAHIFK